MAVSETSPYIPSVVLAALPLLNGTNSVFLMEKVMTFHDLLAAQDNADTPQDPPSPPIFAFILLTRCKSKQGVDVRCTVLPTRMCTTLQRVLLSFLIHTNRDLGNMHGNG